MAVQPDSKGIAAKIAAEMAVDTAAPRPVKPQNAAERDRLTRAAVAVLGAVGEDDISERDRCILTLSAALTSPEIAELLTAAGVPTSAHCVRQVRYHHRDAYQAIQTSAHAVMAATARAAVMVGLYGLRQWMVRWTAEHAGRTGSDAPTPRDAAQAAEVARRIHEIERDYSARGESALRYLPESTSPGAQAAEAALLGTPDAPQTATERPDNNESA